MKERKRVAIGRLELDLRGIPPGTAAGAARALGPALARALDTSTLPDRPAQRLDTGRIATAAAPAPGELAATIAGHLATHLATPAKRGQS